jgi:hypothetical protein
MLERTISSRTVGYHDGGTSSCKEEDVVRGELLVGEELAAGFRAGF